MHPYIVKSVGVQLFFLRIKKLSRNLKGGFFYFFNLSYLQH
ncbi:hypothetical protein HMPREF0653_02546 [Prevotella disiens JCM 6334 = ATCC 29426]|uniref:Uncharacterized protein n=1 Tax=Prevotella disiens JCM 6334 = ATCC 29426 TaxID=1235811 RepID=A0ABP2Y440_9BACT|nr:hypothetical protein HMPREF0653_02546 [Prevotella disiens JCM 6334 = ATCC 29426]